MDILTKRAGSQREHHLSSVGAKSYHIISPTQLVNVHVIMIATVMIMMMLIMMMTAMMVLN